MTASERGRQNHVTQRSVSSSFKMGQALPRELLEEVEGDAWP